MGFEYMGGLEEVWRMWKLGGGDWSEGSLGRESLWWFLRVEGEMDGCERLGFEEHVVSSLQDIF